jgi:acyl CoA:acetate/3-ketoacid CoA transferase alpha subunit
MNKIVESSALAVEGIEDGATVSIGGFGVLQGWPSSAIQALRDRGTRKLTVIANTPDRSSSRTGRSQSWWRPSAAFPTA